MVRVDVDPSTSQLEFRWAARYGRSQLPVRFSGRVGFRFDVVGHGVEWRGPSCAPPPH